MLNGKSVLITGGTGSFGKKFVETILLNYPKLKRVVIYSRDELKQFEMSQQFSPQKYLAIRYFIGDVRDADRLKRAMQGIDIVIHAAALKQVPAAEYNPFECIKTNILGAQNVIDASLDYGVQIVVALSTDKAAAPINLYGATKLCSDKLFVAANNIRGDRDLRLSVVRYGNVMGSRGSVIPFFKEQLSTGVLPITHPEMTRFNISLQDGVNMVLWAIKNAWGGEVLIPKIPSYRITDLAKAIGPDCKHTIIGIRPGEKIHEEMITSSDSLHTVDLGKYYAVLPMGARYTMADYCNHFRADQVPEGFCYNSGDNEQFLNIRELHDLIFKMQPQEQQPRRLRTMQNFSTFFEPIDHAVDHEQEYIPYARQCIDEEDIAAVVSILQSDFITQGSAIAQFEADLLKICKARFAVATNSATSALHLACLALDICPGDHVWTTPITFVATANSALYCGGMVDFIDIDPQTYNISISALEHKLIKAKKSNTLPKVVIAVHLCGQACEMQAIHTLSKIFNFKIIEDASHALGGQYENLPIGNCRYSNITVFSFHPVKIITTAEGGMAVSNDIKLAEKIRRLRSHAITRTPNLMTERSHGPWYYQQLELGFNYRMTDVQAALGSSQLKKLTAFINRRKQIANRYDQILNILPVVLPMQHNDTNSARHLYIIRLRLEEITLTHRQVFEGLQERGIGVNLHYIPVYTQPYYQSLGFKPSDFPNAEKYYSEAISLPLFASMTDKQQNKVCQAMFEILCPQNSVTDRYNSVWQA